eukprot:SAG31_NODE_2695_length_5236_cov_2.505651_3_plen_54_part_00
MAGGRTGQLARLWTLGGGLYKTSGRPALALLPQYDLLNLKFSCATAVRVLNLV